MFFPPKTDVRSKPNDILIKLFLYIYIYKKKEKNSQKTAKFR